MTVPQISVQRRREDVVRSVRVREGEEELLSRFDAIDLQVISHLQEIAPQADLFHVKEKGDVVVAAGEEAQVDRITIVIGAKGKSAFLKGELCKHKHNLKIAFSGEQSPMWTSHLDDVHSLLVARLLHSLLQQYCHLDDVSFAEVHGRIVGAPVDISWFFAFMEKLFGTLKWVIGVDDLHEASKYSPMAPRQILEAIALDLSAAHQSVSWIITTTAPIDSQFTDFIRKVDLNDRPGSEPV
jgi:hypothetical protein